MTMLELAQEDPKRLNADSERFGLSVLARGVEDAALKHEEIAILIHEIVEEITPRLSPENQGVIRQILFEGGRIDGSVEMGESNQEITVDTSKGNVQAEQVLAKDVEFSGDIKIDKSLQVMRNSG